MGLHIAPDAHIRSNPLGTLGQSIGSGISSRIQDMFQQKQLDRQQKEYEESGLPEPLARLAAAATTGGKTEVFKYALEDLKRGNNPFEMNLSAQLGNGQGFEQEQEAEDFDMGLTPSERIRREEGRYKTQLPQYEALEKKVNSLGLENSKIQRLEALNESGNLPSGWGRINVDFKKGELRAPFLGSEDAQEFVKTVNDFLSGAKETFGARVTNFEADRFMRRLPSLLNSTEGRRAVLRQMKLINEINEVENRAIIDQFDKKGGVRKVDYDQAVRVARKQTLPEINRLKKEYVAGEKRLGDISKNQSSAFVRIKKPDGSTGEIPRNNLKKALELGAVEINE
jgi:hypothetical protein